MNGETEPKGISRLRNGKVRNLPIVSNSPNEMEGVEDQFVNDMDIYQDLKEQIEQLKFDKSKLLNTITVLEVDSSENALKLKEDIDKLLNENKNLKKIVDMLQPLDEENNRLRSNNKDILNNMNEMQLQNTELLSTNVMLQKKLQSKDDYINKLRSSRPVNVKIIKPQHTVGLTNTHIETKTPRSINANPIEVMEDINFTATGNNSPVNNNCRSPPDITCLDTFPALLAPGKNSTHLAKITGNKEEQNIASPKRNLLLLTDSHGRNLHSMLDTNKRVKVLNILKPGAKLEGVTNDLHNISKQCDEHDTLVVIGGTNNIESHKPHEVKLQIQKLLQNTTHTNVIVATIPIRHDKPYYNTIIRKVNGDITEEVASFPHASLLPLHTLRRHLYTNHGLHFNGRGKRKITNMISDLVQNSPSMNDTVNLTTEGITPTTSPTRNSSSVSSSPWQGWDNPDTSDLVHLNAVIDRMNLDAELGMSAEAKRRSTTDDELINEVQVDVHKQIVNEEQSDSLDLINFTNSQPSATEENVEMGDTITKHRTHNKDTTPQTQSDTPSQLNSPAGVFLAMKHAII